MGIKRKKPSHETLVILVIVVVMIVVIIFLIGLFLNYRFKAKPSINLPQNQPEPQTAVLRPGPAVTAAAGENEQNIVEEEIVEEEIQSL